MRYMTSIPDSYADSMPSDPDLLVDLGRVAWAAARLHAGVRDSINKHNGSTSMAPFELTLGQAIADLEKLAKNNDRADQADWVRDFGRPASRLRNAVIHAVTFTAPDGKQAIGTVDRTPPGRFLVPDLRAVTLALIEASMKLPA
ncbi:hypothetical protein KZJ38_25085 [Paraburkholderia edwinii]|jgi:hypothetical protein|uniref:Uncharacterized protein n=1 Tax=Paraburkholderia edwinii TaxID=2861782 RepID=A0ABX8V029_9BURK|nr:hypothetical protein [Paraburkholderia edwinii]QYD72957.1 hypothetical protein KZJ38_25085 [Paraburkholderia edwinii]